MKKKILIVDDSALMRRVLCDIINSDERFEVTDMATDGAEGFKFIVAKTYDAVVLDVYMPRMTGLAMLREMQNSKVSARVMMASTTTAEGAKETLEALELGAIDFIKKPENVADARLDEFRNRFLSLLWVVANAPMPKFGNVVAASAADRKGVVFTTRYDVNIHTAKGVVSAADSSNKYAVSSVKGRKIVAIASSTGGPRALQDVIPLMPADLPCPVVLVQHMPKGFTQSLAERLNELSPIAVSEAKEGELLKNGHVYIAAGGAHMNILTKPAGYVIHYTDEPSREGVKPCANYMYESLIDSKYDEIVCVVLTGMGADGTEGIVNLSHKKKVHVIAQNEATCTVYGMPKSIANSGLVNEVVPLTQITEQIIKNVGVR